MLAAQFEHAAADTTVLWLSRRKRGKARLWSWCMCLCVRVFYLSPLMPISLSRDVTDGNVMVLFFHFHHKSWYNGGFVLYAIIALIWKAIALESKSNQGGAHSDENEPIRKDMYLLKGKGMKKEGGAPCNCSWLLSNVSVRSNCKIHFKCKPLKPQMASLHFHLLLKICVHLGGWNGIYRICLDWFVFELHKDLFF